MLSVPCYLLFFYFLCLLLLLFFFFFFFNDTATTEIYTLSLHDALPISERIFQPENLSLPRWNSRTKVSATNLRLRSEEHTSELQSLAYLVCRLLLEKKKKNKQKHRTRNNCKV